MRTTTIKWTLISGLASLALAACSGEGGDPSPADVPEGTASAPLETAPQATTGGEHHDPTRMIQHFDKNGDGKLEVSELPAKMQGFLAKADTDKDGTLSVAELNAAHDAFRAKFPGHGGELGKSMDPASVLARLDKNGDGKLETDELPPPMQKFMSKADTDGDGALTVAEMTAARENFVKARFTHADKNSDGSLTQEELGDRKWARISVADADNSGTVTLPEIEAAVTAGKVHFFPHRHHGHGEGGSDTPASDSPAPVKS
jgi:Ca2+-binding EF-hand superfamily protein